MTDEAAAAPAKASRSSLLRELVVFFLRLGFTAFGGPAAHILPAAALTLALAWAYVRYGALPQSAGVLYGVKPAIIAKGAAIAGAAAFGLWPLFTFFLKVGAVPFGSGYVLLAFLRADLERWHWLTEAQLLDAVAVG
jgi:chromate transporter